MDETSPREILATLIAEHRTNFGALSRLLGRNPAYIQQFIKRGTPRRLDERDRRVLAEFFGVDEGLLGAPEREDAEARGQRKTAARPTSVATAQVPKLALEASAGTGAIAGEEWASEVIGFDRHWLKRLGLRPENLSIIDVKGESMAPTLNNGDTIMVDRSDGVDRLRDGIYVLRLDTMLMVKRIALSPRKGRMALAISSDNPHYPSWEDVDRALVDIVGRVVWTARVLS